MADELSRPQLPSRRVSMEMERFIIDLTPCSTAPSSPTVSSEEGSEYVDAEKGSAYFDCKSTLSSQITSDEDRPVQSVVQDMVRSLKTMYKSRASRELIAASEETLTDCLYHNPVTLADVEALIPALSRNYKLLNRLSTNIGLYHARRHIPPPALESMLTHIFTHDDYKYSLFPRTTAQIERFEHEHAEYQLRLLTPLQRKSKQKDEAFQRRKAAAKVHRAADHIRMSIPPRYGTKSAHSFLPDGCSSIANIITEVDGMKWTQALHVIRAPWYMLMLNRAPIQCC